MMDRQNILQALEDASCDQKTQERFLRLLDIKQMEEAIRVLQIHRCTLLEHLHQDERRIDCLDYLVHHLRKSAGSSRTDNVQH